MSLLIVPDDLENELQPQLAVHIGVDEARPYRVFTVDDSDGYITAKIFPGETDPPFLYGITLESNHDNGINLFMTPNANSHFEVTSLLLFLKSDLNERDVRNSITQKVGDIITPEKIKFPYPPDAVSTARLMNLSLHIKDEVYPYGLRTQWDLHRNILHINVIFSQNNAPTSGWIYLPDIIASNISEQIKRQSIDLEEMLRGKDYISTDVGLSFVTRVVFTQFKR